MKLQPGWQLIAIHILTNMSRSKGNQAIKIYKRDFYNINAIRETFFPKNHTQNVVGKLFPDLFLKRSKLSISLDR